MKKLIFFYLITIAVAGLSLSSYARVVDKIIATVEGQPITTYELKNIAGFYRNTPNLLNVVIDDYVIMYHAKKLGIDVTDKDVNRFIKNVAVRNGMSVDEFLKRLKDSGIDLHYYRLGVKLQLYRRKFAMRMFGGSIRISDADIQRYFKLHKGEFKSTPVLVMSIIAVKNRDLADKIYSMVHDNPSLFGKLKRLYSTDKTPSKAIPLNAFNTSIRSQLATLKPGEISPIIEANGTYYIVKLLRIEKEEPGALKNQIKDVLFAKRIEAKLNSWLKMVKARTDIEIFE